MTRDDQATQQSRHTKATAMTTTDRTRTYKPTDLGLEPEFMEAVAEMSRRNDEFYKAHREEISRLLETKCVLIHSGTTYEVFDDWDELLRFTQELDPVVDSSATAWYPIATPAIW